MSFRRRLLVLVTLVVVAAVGSVSVVVWSMVRNSFARADRDRTEALVAQFQREFEQRGEEVARRVQGIAASDSAMRMALEFARTSDTSLFVNDAGPAAQTHQLDFLEYVSAEGTIISSAQWPARFGYREPAISEVGRAPFLKREELPDGWTLGLFSVGMVNIGDKPLYVVGGQRIDNEFLRTLVLPAGMRVKLHRIGPAHLEVSLRPPGEAQPLAVDPELKLVARVLVEKKAASEVIDHSSDPADSEAARAIPLSDANGDVLGVLVIANSRRPYVELEQHVRSVALIAAALGILLAILVSSWAAGRVTRPVEQVAEAAREVAAGHWDTQVTVTAKNDIGELAENFNRMTRELVTQRERALQAERVAAWRELARRLAHELKNPLFPLQLTIENLTRARQQSPEQFDEVFRESTATLLAELANLKEIIGRFSDFSKMPQPHFQKVDVNELLRRALKIFEAQFVGTNPGAAGRPPIAVRTDFDTGLPPIAADPELLHRALSNLILNALDAMPQSGTLTLRTRMSEGVVIVEVADTGGGLTEEERQRLFTPYYTSKQHGTGLGLAIVQSVVTDHKGSIAVESAPGKGTTFRIELPASPELRVANSEQ